MHLGEPSVRPDGWTISRQFLLLIDLINYNQFRLAHWSCPVNHTVMSSTHFASLSVELKQANQPLAIDNREARHAGQIRKSNC